MVEGQVLAAGAIDAGKAVAQEDGEGEPVVCDVLRSGYRLKDRVLRPESERFLDVPYADPTFDHVDQFFANHAGLGLGLEADFVVEHRRRLTAIEVKSTAAGGSPTNPPRYALSAADDPANGVYAPYRRMVSPFSGHVFDTQTDTDEIEDALTTWAEASAAAQITVVDQDDRHVYQPGLLFVPFGLAHADGPRH